MTGYDEYRPHPHNVLYRHHSSHMAMRYMYTHSEFSSSLSSLSTNSQNTVYSHASMRQGNSTVVSRATSFFKQIRALKGIAIVPERARAFVGLASAFIVIASSAGLCLTHGIFESSYQFSYTTSRSRELEEEKEEQEMQSRYTMIIGALQIAGFVGAQGMSCAVMRWIGNKRAVLLLGAVLCSGGLLTAGYTGQLWQLCLTQGVVVGVGCGISYGAVAIPILVDVTRKWGRACVLAMAAGVGGSALALIVQRIFLQSNHNAAVTLRWLALLVGGLQAVGILFAREPDDESSDAMNSISEHHNGMMLFLLDSNPNESKTASALSGSSANGQVQEPQYRVSQKRSLRLVSGAVASYASVCVYRMSSMVPALLLPGYVDRMVVQDKRGYSGAAMLAVLSLASGIGGALAARSIPCAEHSPVDMRRSNAIRSAVLSLLALSVWGLWLPASSSWAMVSAFCVVHGALFGAMQQNLVRAGVADAGKSVVLVGVLLGQVVFAVVGICVAGWLFVGVGNSESYAPTIMFAAATATAAAVLAAASAILLF
ncbi:hypothetical protein LPJ59_003736 [Coemansia sp. RSA 2399]|nr:hypothetical protein LPJ59_003736 [Coemansia sp. RSA 2399]KAJ1903245.1 hypothetical protein LPJ81_003160 [Coemansia sp. IMI 209127]